MVLAGRRPTASRQGPGKIQTSSRQAPDKLQTRCCQCLGARQGPDKVQTSSRQAPEKVLARHVCLTKVQTDKLQTSSRQAPDEHHARWCQGLAPQTRSRQAPYKLQTSSMQCVASARSPDTVQTSSRQSPDNLQTMHTAMRKEGQGTRQCPDKLQTRPRQGPDKVQARSRQPDKPHQALSRQSQGKSQAPDKARQAPHKQRTKARQGPDKEWPRSGQVRRIVRSRSWQGPEAPARSRQAKATTSPGPAVLEPDGVIRYCTGESLGASRPWSQSATPSPGITRDVPPTAPDFSLSPPGRAVHSSRGRTFSERSKTPARPGGSEGVQLRLRRARACGRVVEHRGLAGAVDCGAWGLCSAGPRGPSPSDQSRLMRGSSRHRLEALGAPARF